jgi:hypothetical protein
LIGNHFDILPADRNASVAEHCGGIATFARRDRNGTNGRREGDGVPWLRGSFVVNSNATLPDDERIATWLKRLPYDRPTTPCNITTLYAEYSLVEEPPSEE